MTPYPPPATSSYPGLVQLPSGMTALSDWLDQAIKAASSPSFASVTAIAAATQDAVKLSPRAGGTGSYTSSLTTATLTGNRTLTAPDASGTIVIGGGTCSGASSGTNTGDQTSVSGNAGTATALQNTRTIGGSNFDGTSNVTSFPVPGAIGGTTPSTGAFTTLTTTGKLTNYNGISTVSNGIPSELATVDLTTQAASIGATTIYTPAATGLFRVSIYCKVTRTATTSSSIGGNLWWTDGDDSVLVLPTIIWTIASGTTTALVNNTTSTVGCCTMVIYAKTGTAIQYSTNYASVGGTSMQYSLHIKIEAL